MITEARRRGETPPVEFKQGDIDRLPFPDDTFDATRADRVFQHLGDPTAALEEICRVTRSGGVVSVVDPDWETLVIDMPNRPLFRKIREHSLDSQIGRTIGSQLFNLFRRAGLGEVTVVTAVLLTISDFSVARQLANLDEMGDAALAAGAITPAEHQKWLETLHSFEDSVPFFAAVGGVGVIGTKR